MEKIKEYVLLIWKDPVWSKVISVAILGLIDFCYLLISTNMNNHSLKSEVTNQMTIKVDLWIVIVLILITMLLFLFKRKDNNAKNVIMKQKSGKKSKNYQAGGNINIGKNDQ